MLAINTMSYGTDGFEFRKQSLMKAIDAWDFSYETSVGNFIIKGTEPDDTNRRVIFAIGDKLYKFGNDGLTEYDERGELEDILENGNTVGELLEVQNIPEFVGKRVYPIIALDAPFDAPVMPKIHISVNVRSYNDIYQKTKYSPIYRLEYTGNAAKIIGVKLKKTLRGYATCEVHCRLMNRFGNWQDWIELDDAAYQEAIAIQFRVRYVISTLDGSDSISIDSVEVDYTADVDKNVGKITEIVTKQQEYIADFGTCYALLKHAALGDAKLQAFVNFRAPAVERRDIVLGVTNGEEQTFTLADSNIDQSSLHLALDGVGIYNFYYNTKNSTVTLTAEGGKEITASYNCEIAAEDWREMQFDFTRLDGDHYNSRFIYYLNDYTNKKISAVKFRMTRETETPDVLGYIVGWTPKI